MASVIANRVLETSTTAGSGAYTLAGAVVGYQSFASSCVAGDTVDYYAEDVDGNGVATANGWETGTGTWGTGGILTRTSIESSSNAGSAVAWAAGTRRIALTLTAGAAKRARNSSVPMLNLGTVSGAVTLDLSIAHSFSINLSAAATLSISNVASGVMLERVVIQIITNGFTVTWPSGVAWTKASPPTNYMSGKTLVELDTFNNGATFCGIVLNPTYESIAQSSAYWRFYITATNGDTYVEVCEVFFMLNSSVVSVPANIVSTASSTVFSIRTASNMFDGSVGTGEDATWCSDGTAMPQWASVRYSSAITVDAINVYPAVANTSTRSTRDFSLQKSADGVTWTNVKSWTGQSSWTSGTPITLSLL